MPNHLFSYGVVINDGVRKEIQIQNYAYFSAGYLREIYDLEHFPFHL